MYRTFGEHKRMAQVHCRALPWKRSEQVPWGSRRGQGAEERGRIIRPKVTCVKGWKTHIYSRPAVCRGCAGMCEVWGFGEKRLTPSLKEIELIDGQPIVKATPPEQTFSATGTRKPFLCSRGSQRRHQDIGVWTVLECEELSRALVLPYPWPLCMMCQWQSPNLKFW